MLKVTDNRKENGVDMPLVNISTLDVFSGRINGAPDDLYLKLSCGCQSLTTPHRHFTTSDGKSVADYKPLNAELIIKK